MSWHPWKSDFERCKSSLIVFVLLATMVLGPSDGRGQDGQADGIAVHAKAGNSRCWLANPTPNTLQKWLPLELTSIEGEILEVNRDEVVYVVAGETQMRKILGDQVVAIDIEWGSDQARLAHEAFVSNDPTKSFEMARKAIQSGILRWQQRVLVSEMVDASRVLGKWSTAGKVFLTLSSQNPPTIHFASIPLTWVQQDLDRQALDLAKEWMDREEEEARLIAASWLLPGNSRSQAISVLDELAKSRRTEIAKLATSQLWRTVPAAEVASQRYAEWSALRNAMPHPLQVGPTQLIADKLDQAGQTESAITEWLRIATLHPDRYDAVSSAIEKATAALNRLGRKEEAERLKRLVRDRPGREQRSAE